MRYVRLFNFTALLSLSLVSQGFSIPDDLDVAIVGGGLSGLRATHVLHQNGERSYGLYEARNRWGGRTYSETHHNHVFNMGGEWIDSDHIKMHAVVKELGIPLQKENYDAPVRIPFAGKEMSDGEKVTFLKEILAELDKVDTQDLFTTESTYKPLSEVLPSSLNSDQKEFVECYLKGEEGLPSHQMSSVSFYTLKENLKEYLQLFEYKASWWKPAFARNQLAYQHRVVGGMSVMTEAIHAQLDSERTHLNHVLTEVSKDADQKYHLFFQVGDEVHEVTARSVIMTVPFSVLRGIDLDESLGLSELSQEAIRTLSYGTNSKVQVVTDQEHDLRYLVHTPTQSISWRPPSSKGLTICLGGEEGEKLDSNSARNIISSVLSSLSKKENDSTPPQLIVKNWSEDPFSRGSYSTGGLHGIGLDLESDDPDFKGLRNFAKPTADFIFAGEHTQVENGFMESAVRSGEWAAKYYLRHKSALVQ